MATQCPTMSNNTSYTSILWVVICANFHLNWMKTVEVVPPTRFCNIPTDWSTYRPTIRWLLQYPLTNFVWQGYNNYRFILSPGDKCGRYKTVLCHSTHTNLWYEWDVFSQGVEPDLSDVNPVNLDESSGLGESHQRSHEGALPRSRPSHNPNLRIAI